MTDGPINIKIELTPGSRQRKSGEYLKPSPESGGSWTASCSAPPIKVPIARPTNARGPKSGSIHAPRVTPPTMDPILKKLEAIAGIPKTLFEFNIPMTKAAMDTMTMKGNMIRVSCAVRAAFSGPNPGANRPTSCDENTMPARHIDPRTTRVNVATLFASRHAASSPLRAMVLVNVVTNAVDSAPSANRSRSRFGMRNAAVNASIAPPPPNKAAQTCSRTSPSTRLPMTARPMIPAAFVFSRSVRGDFGSMPEFMSDRCFEETSLQAIRLRANPGPAVPQRRPGGATGKNVDAMVQKPDAKICAHARQSGRAAASRSAAHGGAWLHRHRVSGNRRIVPHSRAAGHVEGSGLRDAGTHQLCADPMSGERRERGGALGCAHNDGVLRIRGAAHGRRQRRRDPQQHGSLHPGFLTRTGTRITPCRRWIR